MKKVICFHESILKCDPTVADGVVHITIVSLDGTQFIPFIEQGLQEQDPRYAGFSSQLANPYLVRNCVRVSGVKL
jgi:hypothetical protein